MGCGLPLYVGTWQSALEFVTEPRVAETLAVLAAAALIGAGLALGARLNG